MRLIPLTAAKPAFTAIATISLSLLALQGCAKHDSSNVSNDTTGAAGTATTAAAPTGAAAAGSASASDITPVRGTLAKVSDSVLTVSTASGDVRIRVESPLHVFARVPAKLASVTPNSFVGVTSVAQPDGSERATEIHIFPEELRGTGEGSYLMTGQGGNDSSHAKRTMTNGTVSASAKTGAPPRMTNGTIASKAGESLTVDYRGGSRTIMIPPEDSVTALAPSEAKLVSGARVVVLGKKQPNGSMRASSLVLADSSARSK
jgi:hypothetical protein